VVENLYLLRQSRLTLKSESLVNHLRFFNKGYQLKYTRLLVVGFLLVKLIRLMLAKPLIVLTNPLKGGIFFLFHDRKDLLPIIQENIYFTEVNFFFGRSHEPKPDPLESFRHQAKCPSFSIIRRYRELYYKNILSSHLLSIRGAKYVAEVVMQASIMEANNLLDIPKIYSFGYLHAGGVLLTEYTTSIERNLYSVQHGYFFENPILNNLHGVEVMEDGADTLLAWTLTCITKLEIAFSEMGTRTPAIESLELDNAIEKQDSDRSSRVILLLTKMPNLSHVAEANRFIDVCLEVGMRPVVTLHPTERNLKSLFMYARHLKANFRYLSITDSREFFDERFILSNGSSLLFFAFLNGAKVGYWDDNVTPINGSLYHFVDEHINNKATLKTFLMES